MISVHEAFTILQRHLPPQRVGRVSLVEAHGRVLAREVRTEEPIPRYTNSAMDGFAVRWTDVKNAGRETPVLLAITGESRAGVPFSGTVHGGEAVRISTGAMLPPGVDTVIRVEETRETDGVVSILSAPQAGQDVRREGEEFHKGDCLLPRGVRLDARRIALPASAGIKDLHVYLTPKVTILVTGTELAEKGSSGIQDWQIHDSNSLMLACSVKEAGGEVVRCRRVEDQLDQTTEAIEAAAGEGVDLILTSGGVSVGEHDHVRKAAKAAGFEQLFWRIRQKPGKPLYAARKGQTLLMGLPGNPVSAFICFSYYIRPIIAHLSGMPMAWPHIIGRTDEEVSNQGGRTQFVRVSLDRKSEKDFRIRKLEKQGSHMIGSIARADGYILLQPGEVRAKGSPTDVVLFEPPAGHQDPVV